MGVIHCRSGKVTIRLDEGRNFGASADPLIKGFIHLGKSLRAADIGLRAREEDLTAGGEIGPPRACRARVFQPSRRLIGWRGRAE